MSFNKAEQLWNEERFSIEKDRGIGPVIPLTRLMILYQPSYVYTELTLTVIEDGFQWKDGPFHCPLKDQIREKELWSFKSLRTDNTSRTTSNSASGAEISFSTYGL